MRHFTYNSNHCLRKDVNQPVLAKTLVVLGWPIPEPLRECKCSSFSFFQPCRGEPLLSNNNRGDNSFRLSKVAKDWLSIFSYCYVE